MNNDTRRPIMLIAAIVILVVVYQLITAVVLKSSTGLLVVHTNQPGSSLAVTQGNSLEASIGTGNATVRIKPGSFSVSATNDGNTATQQVSIAKQKTTSVYLVPKAQKLPPQQAAPSLAQQATDNSIYAQLPFVGPAFSYIINGAFSGPNDSVFTVVVTAPDANSQQQATTWLNGLGYNSSNLNIQYDFGPVPE